MKLFNFKKKEEEQIAYLQREVKRLQEQLTFKLKTDVLKAISPEKGKHYILFVGAYSGLSAYDISRIDRIPQFSKTMIILKTLKDLNLKEIECIKLKKTGGK